MATIYKCDKCHKEFGQERNVSSITTPLYQHYAHSIEDWPRKTYDLCADCIRSLNEYLKPDAKEKEN